MSDNDKPSISRIIGAWIIEKGTVTQYKDGVHYRKIKAGEERADALFCLIHSLLKAGYDKEVITSKTTFNQVLEACIIPTARTKNKYREKRENWENQIKEEWAFQLNEVFGKEDASLLALDVIRVKAEPKPIPEEKPGWIPPKGKLDMEKFKGFETSPEFDEEFIKVLEDLKNGK